MMLMTVRPAIFSSTVFMPGNEKMRIFASAPAVMEYDPSAPVFTVVLAPFIITVTPLRGDRLTSVTVPVMRTCVAGAREVSRIIAMIDKSVFMMFRFYVSEIRMHRKEKFHKQIVRKMIMSYL